MRLSPRVWFWVAVIGAVLIIAGFVFGWVVFPMAVEQKIGEELSLKQGTEAWERFVNLPLPLDFKLYVFNVTNPEEVAKGAKPHMQELGPYVYKQHRQKYKVEFNEKDDTVSYYQSLQHEFDAERSGNLRENDPIIIINPVLLGMFAIMENIAVLSKTTILVEQAAPLLFGSSGMFLKTTSGDLLFHGVRIPCGQVTSGGAGLARGRERGTTGGRLPTPPPKLAAAIVCSSMKRIKLQTIKELKNGDLLFSLFGYKNETNGGRYDGRYTVRTGISTPKLLAQIVSWEGRTRVSAWGGPTCNAINGTQGDIFSPYITRDTTLEVFSTDICRTMPVRYEKDTVYRGINAYRFGPGPEVMADAMENGDNYCFCPQVAKDLTKENACLKRGALDLSGCQGVPVIVTYPHFYGAHPDYVNGVEGLKPIREIHSMTLDIEPMTGTPLLGGKKMQMNMQMKPIPGVEMTKHLRDTLVPIAWMYEGAELNDDFIELLNNLLFNTLKILDGVTYGLLGVGFFMFGLGIVMYFVARRRTPAVSPREDRPADSSSNQVKGPTNNGRRSRPVVPLEASQGGPDGNSPRIVDMHPADSKL